MADRVRVMRLGTYFVACLAMLAWAVPIVVVANAVTVVYQRGFFPSFAMAVTYLVPPFARVITLSAIGLLFSLLVPMWLRSRRQDNWALGMVFLSLGTAFVFAVLPEILPLIR